jgi:hypothetical protein
VTGHTPWSEIEHKSPPGGKKKCMVDGCRATALPQSVGQGKLALDDGQQALIDLYACKPHRDWLARDSLAHLSVSIQATPARPR